MPRTDTDLLDSVIENAWETQKKREAHTGEKPVSRAPMNDDEFIDSIVERALEIQSPGSTKSAPKATKSAPKSAGLSDDQLTALQSRHDRYQKQRELLDEEEFELERSLLSLPPEVAEATAQGIYPLPDKRPGMDLSAEDWKNIRESEGLGKRGLLESYGRSLTERAGQPTDPMGGSWSYALPFAGDVSRAKDLAGLYRRAKRYDKDEYAPGYLGQAQKRQDERYLENYQSLQEELSARGETVWATIGKGVLESGKLAAEMAATGGGSLGIRGVKGLSDEGIKKAFSAGVRSALKKLGTKAGVKATGKEAGKLTARGGLHALAAPGRTTAEAARRMMPTLVEDAEGNLVVKDDGENLAKALVNGYLNSMLMATAEQSGEYVMAPLMPVLKKLGTKSWNKLGLEERVAGKFIGRLRDAYIKKGNTASSFTKLMKEGKFDSFMGEFAEERVEEALMAAVSEIPGVETGSWEDMKLDLRQYMIEAAVIGGLKGISGAPGVAQRLKDTSDQMRATRKGGEAAPDAGPVGVAPTEEAETALKEFAEAETTLTEETGEGPTIKAYKRGDEWRVIIRDTLLTSPPPELAAQYESKVTGETVTVEDLPGVLYEKETSTGEPVVDEEGVKSGNQTREVWSYDQGKTFWQRDNDTQLPRRVPKERTAGLLERMVGSAESAETKPAPTEQAPAEVAPKENPPPEPLPGAGELFGDDSPEVYASKEVQFRDPKTLNLNPSVFQFKSDIDPETGEVKGQKLEGDFNVASAGVMIAYEWKDGKTDIVEGHHRLAHALRNNVNDVAVQVYREADGVTPTDARALGAMANIQAGQGSQADWATFFRNAKEMTHEDAKRNSLLARPKQREAWTIGRFSTGDVFSKFKSGDITAAQARAIAEIAGKDEGLQGVGLKLALEGKSGVQLENMLRGLLAMKPSEQKGPKQATFAWDTVDQERLDQAEKMAKAAGQMSRELRERISVLKAALNKGGGKALELTKEEADRYNIKNRRDRDEIERAVTKMEAERDLFDRLWDKDKEMFQRVAQRAGIEFETEPEIETAPEPAPQPAAESAKPAEKPAAQPAPASVDPTTHVLKKDGTPFPNKGTAAIAAKKAGEPGGNIEELPDGTFAVRRTTPAEPEPEPGPVTDAAPAPEPPDARQEEIFTLQDREKYEPGEALVEYDTDQQTWVYGEAARQAKIKQRKNTLELLRGPNAEAFIASQPAPQNKYSVEQAIKNESAELTDLQSIGALSGKNVPANWISPVDNANTAAAPASEAAAAQKQKSIEEERKRIGPHLSRYTKAKRDPLMADQFARDLFRLLVDLHKKGGLRKHDVARVRKEFADDYLHEDQPDFVAAAAEIGVDIPSPQAAQEERERKQAEYRKAREARQSTSSGAGPVTAGQIDAVDPSARANLFQRKGEYHLPGLLAQDQIEAGRLAYMIEAGKATMDEWDELVKSSRQQNRFTDSNAPVRPPAEAVPDGYQKGYGYRLTGKIEKKAGRQWMWATFLEGPQKGQTDIMVPLKKAQQKLQQRETQKAEAEASPVPDAAPAPEAPAAEAQAEPRRVSPEVVSWETKIEGLLEHAGQFPEYVAATARRMLQQSRNGEITDYAAAMEEWANVVKTANIRDAHLYAAPVKQQSGLFGGPASTLFGSAAPETVNLDTASPADLATQQRDRWKTIVEGIPKFAYAGINAHPNIRPKGVDRALEMEMAGEGWMRIRDVTGWHRGMDGAWRFEIDDSQAAFNIPESGVFDGELGDVLSHSALYEAYPDLQATGIFVTIDSESKREGMYWPANTPNDSEVIEVYAPDEETAMKILLHELQHAIQEREYFARGGSPSLFGEGTQAREQYRRLAGELEARDVANRRALDEEERRVIAPVKRDDAIVAPPGRKEPWLSDEDGTETAHHDQVEQRAAQLDAAAQGRVRTRVVQSIEDLPDAIHVQAAAQGVKLANVPAVFHNGEVYLISDNVRPGTLEQWWAHEHVSHEGLDALLGADGAQAFYRRVAEGVGRAAMQAAVDPVYHNLPDADLASEYVAKIAEQKQRGGFVTAEQQGLLSRIVEFFREIMKNLGVDVRLNDRDIERMLAAASQHLRAAPKQGTRFSVDSEQEAETPATIQNAALPNLPALVELAQALTEGKIPRVRRALGRALGRFRHGEGEEAEGSVELLADLFAGPILTQGEVSTKRADEVEKQIIDTIVAETGVDPADLVVRRHSKPGGKTLLRVMKRDHDFVKRVLAHEIGHAWDWMDEKTLKRGNVLGHIAALHGFLKHTLTDTPPAESLTEQDRKDMRREAYRRTREAGYTMKDNPEEFKEYRKNAYAAVLAEKVRSRGLVTQETISQELKDLTQWWKPFDENSVSPAHKAYRYSANELIADALSVMINNPDAFQSRAPAFARAWQAYMEARPIAAKAYEDMQKGLREGSGGTLSNKIDSMFDRFENRMRELLQHKKPHEKGQRRRSFARLMNEGFATKAAAVEQFENDLIEQGRPMTNKESGFTSWHRYLYAGSTSKLMVMKLKERVWRPLKHAGLNQRIFDRFRFLRRVAYNPGDADKANALGVQQSDALKELQAMEEKLGEKAMAALEHAQKAWAQVHDEFVLTPMEKTGAFPADLIAEWRSRADYSKVDVVKQMDARYGSGTGLRVFSRRGSLEDQAPPTVADMMQDVRFIKALKLNTAKLKALDLLQRVGELRPALREFRDGRMQWVDPSDNIPQGERPTRGLLMVMQDGQLNGYDVPLGVARQFDRSRTSPGSAAYYGAVLWQGVGTGLRVTMDPFRLLWIHFSAGWRVANVLRDSERSMQNAPGISPYLAYPVELLKTLPDVLQFYRGHLTPLVEEMLAGDELVVVEERRVLHNEESHLRRLHAAYGVENMDFRGMPYWQRPLAVIWYLSRTSEQFTEDWSKFTSHKLLEKNPDLDLEDVAEKVRTQMSTPSVLEGGWLKPVTNNAMPFSNIKAQGIKADYKALTGSTRLSAKEFAKGVRRNPDIAAKRFGTTIGAQTLQWGFRAGWWAFLANKLIGDDDNEFWQGIKRWINKKTKQFQAVSLHDIMNYWVAVTHDYGEDDTGRGQVLLHRIPKDETDRVLTALFTTTAKSIQDAFGSPMGEQYTESGQQGKGPLLETLDAIRQSASYAADELPGINPAVTIGLAFWELFMEDENPEDPWTGQPVVDPTLFAARNDPAVKGTGAVGKEFGAWVLDEAGVTKYYNVPSAWDKREPLVEEGTYGRFLQEQKRTKGVKAAVLNDFMGRFSKVSEYGREQTMQEELLDPIRDEQAGNRYIKQFLTEYIVEHGILPKSMTTRMQSVYFEHRDDILDKVEETAKNQNMDLWQRMKSHAKNKAEEQAIDDYFMMNE